MGQPVVHFEVQGNDRKVLAQFYAQLFGWTTNDVSEMDYTLVETGGEGGINGGIGSTPELFGRAGENDEQAFAVMDAAWELGIRWFDTADRRMAL